MEARACAFLLDIGHIEQLSKYVDIGSIESLLYDSDACLSLGALCQQDVLGKGSALRQRSSGRHEQPKTKENEEQERDERESPLMK